MTATAKRNGMLSHDEQEALTSALTPPDFSRDMLQMKMENETIMAECRIRPRDMEAIKEQLAGLLAAFPELAEEAIYSKPVGKGDDGKEKFAEGLSIRAAEVLAEAYGYNRVRCDAAPLPDGSAKVEATFTDFQNGRIWQDGGVVPKRYKASARSGGGMKEHPDDRFWGVVVKAESSRRIREVINRSVNAALKAWFENECRKVLTRVLTDDKVEAIIKQFRTIGVTLEMLDRVIGRPSSMGWLNSDRQKLLGIWNAIKAGEITMQEAFAVQTEAPASARKSKLNDISHADDASQTEPDSAQNPPHEQKRPSRKSVKEQRAETAPDGTPIPEEIAGPKGEQMFDNDYAEAE